MGTNLKHSLSVLAILATLSLASCQSELIDPQAVPGKKNSVLAEDTPADQPPKDRDGGGN